MWVSLPPGELRQRRHLLIRRAMVPDVLRRLLREPDLSPKEVLTIAARRPSSPAIVDELCASPWLDRIEVRSALALNPFTPTATALMLVPTCRSRLRQVLRANVHPRVHALARMCLDARDGCPREGAPLSERSDSDE